MSVGTSLIERKEVKMANGFRYAIIENDYLKDVALFQYPLALTKLAIFIMEVYSSLKSKAKEKKSVRVSR